MARFADGTKERVRQAANLIEVISAKTDLRRTGGDQWMGRCPFHEERTGSFSVTPSKGLYHCFGCQKGGDIFMFVQETEGVSFPEAVEILADRFGVVIEREEEDPRAAERRRARDRSLEIIERATTFYERKLWEADEAADARAYLLERGLTEEVLRAFRVGYAPSRWDALLVPSRQAGFTEGELIAAGLVMRSQQRPGAVYDRFRRRITFPLADVRGRVRGFGARVMPGSDDPAKYVNTSENDVFHKSAILYGAHLARADAAKAQSIVLVEGYTDVIALHQAGLRNSVAVMGTSLTEEQVTLLAQLVGADGDVTMALDADAAGQQAMVRSANVARARALRLSVAPLPEGADPADLVARDGAEAITSLVASSQAFARFAAERILSSADLDRADGRDRALGELRELLGGMPASVEREEVVRIVAGRLGLSEQLVASLGAGAAPAGVRSSVSARPNGDGNGGGARSALDTRGRSEAAFLALCIALPEQGAGALASVDPETHFTVPVLQRAAAHLREHLDDPGGGVTDDDPQLTSALAELVMRSDRDPADRATLEVQRLQLELARLDRVLATARSEQSGDVTPLAREREAARLALDAAMEDL